MIWYYQNLINETLSTPLSTLEAENYVPAKHAEAEPEIRVCLWKKVYLFHSAKPARPEDVRDIMNLWVETK